MTTAQQIFEETMALTDNLDDSGRADTNDNREYKHRTLPILNTLINEVFPYSDTYKRTQKGKRPICPIITAFDQEIGLDDFICHSILTEGLAYNLFMDENPSIAGTHLQVYQERLRELKSGIGLPAVSEDIVDVYSGGYEDPETGEWVNTGLQFPHNNYGRW